jgi:hypothetical protein
MFRALPGHPQEALHKRRLVYCMRVVSWLHKDWSGTLNMMRVMSVGCTRIGAAN